LATVQDEFRAIDVLRNSLHKNIVEVFQHGELEYMTRYFIDMELCDLNLQAYIYGDFTPAIVQECPYFTVDLPPRMKVAQIWSMMGDVTNGLIHIHSLGQVHRDIKPQNSKTPLPQNTPLTVG
jgi:serine/threonine protein kinase